MSKVKDVLLLSLFTYLVFTLVHLSLFLIPFILRFWLDRYISAGFQSGQLTEKDVESFTGNIVYSPWFYAILPLLLTVLSAPVLTLFLIRRNNWFSQLSYTSKRAVVLLLTLLLALISFRTVSAFP